MISTVTIADQASSTTVQAASGYSGKIYKHWCKLRTAKSKRSKTIKKLSVGTKVTVEAGEKLKLVTKLDMH